MIDFIIERYNFWIYVILMMIGLYAMITKRNLVKKVIGMNIFQTSIILFFISLASKRGGTLPIMKQAHGLENFPVAGETGGLSGRPLKDASTAVIRQLHARLQGKVPIIGVGGIENADDAWEKLTAGADLVQIYTAFIYDGPGIVQEIVRGLEERVQMSGCRDLPEAVAKARAYSRNQV